MLVERLAAASIPTHFLDLRKPWEYFVGVGRLAGLLREQRAEIVQTFLFHANVLGARAGRAAGVSRLVTGIRVADPRRWRTIVERWATTSADRMICVSQGVADFCRGRGFAAEKLVVIPNGIDLARWTTAQPADLQPFGVVAGRRLFVFVGRLDEQKGLLPFLAELPRVFRELPEDDFLLVGEGPQLDTLRDEVRRLQIAHRVHFAGWQADVPAIMAVADLLVLPSRWEGMPNVILEAMASQKPVVAMNAEGVTEILGNAAEQQTAAVGQWTEFADRIVKILSNRELALRLGELNQSRVQEFSFDLMVAAYSQLYTSLAQQSREK
jgi:glycosyltransferase involved in cell wall biosynthesis